MRRGVIIAVAIAIAAALGFIAQRQWASSSAPPSDLPAAPPAASATPANVSPVAPAIPATLPTLTLQDRDGKSRALNEWTGRPVMLNFWATWCAPCRREIPLLNSLREQRAAQRLEIVGVAVDFREEVLKYAQETTIAYPLLIGEEDGLAAVKAFGMQPAFPFTVFADSQQRIVALKIGELHQDEADLILDLVARVDSGAVTLAQGREQISAGLKDIATRRALATGGAGT
jgi:thiol-disulfide isomerase/thioredoxin